jgi:hypothetical protein
VTDNGVKLRAEVRAASPERKKLKMALDQMTTIENERKQPAESHSATTL